MPLLSHFRTDPDFSKIVGDRKEVALTTGNAAMMTDTDGNLLMFIASFDDGMFLRTKLGGKFNCTMFALPAKYQAKTKQNGQLFPQKC